MYKRLEKCLRVTHTERKVIERFEVFPLKFAMCGKTIQSTRDACFFPKFGLETRSFPNPPPFATL